MELEESLIKKLAAYIGQYKKYVLVVPFVVLLDVLCELSMPLLMSKIVDIGIPGKDIRYISNIGLIMVGLALVAIAGGIANMWFTSRGSMGFGANLRDALFEKLQSFSFKNIDQFSTASLVTRLTNDVNNLQQTFMMSLRILMRAPMMLIVSFILAYSINSELSIVLAIAIPVLIAFVAIIMRFAVGRFGVMQEKIDAINRVIQENLIGIRVVKSFVRSDFEIKKFQKANDDFTNSAIRAITIAILTMPVMMFVLNGATLAVIWLGGGMVMQGTLGTGQLISFTSYIMQIMMSVMMISMVMIMGARAEASAKRVIEVLDTEVDIAEKPQFPNLLPDKPSVDSSPRITAGKVEFRDVSFKYNLNDTEGDILCHIDFTANPGEVVGIVGSTGSGKSTLISLIPRLYDVTEGKVLIDGVDVRDYELESLREGIGVVLQKNILFSGSIKENLLWGNKNATDAEIEAACKDAQIHDFIASLPKGYDTELGQGGVNVSGGQKQRLCIARAMIKKPKILILDDSTSAVDSANEAKIREAFNKSLVDTTVFIIAQRISSVRNADKIIVLDEGKVVGMGTHKELLQQNDIYQEILASQREGVMSNA
ncbi:ABC-type multidrug transport system, ATPase and permease components [Leptolinea tardivitalis]|nr:ABC-type multidrug transport system, ATPase and permease components [Leptolinea tardivitalis]